MKVAYLALQSSHHLFLNKVLWHVQTTIMGLKALTGHQLVGNVPILLLIFL